MNRKTRVVVHRAQASCHLGDGNSRLIHVVGKRVWREKFIFIMFLLAGDRRNGEKINLFF